MPDFDFDSHFESQNQQVHPVNGNLADDSSGRSLPEHDEDLLMEQILENINTTPIGQVLKKIASLPEVRKKKIMDVRQQLTEGKYDLKKRLNIVLDKVLEDLTT